MGFGTKRIDYWPDHYAFLNVVPNATLKDISHAIREFRAAVHPDQNRRANEEMKIVLERLRKHIDEAEEVLTDTDGLRAAFNDYREQHPERIATVNRGDGVLTSVVLGGAWQSAGAGNIATNFIKSAGDPYRPLLSVEETIQDVVDDIIPNTIQQRANALLEGKTDRPLLLPPPTNKKPQPCCLPPTSR